MTRATLHYLTRPRPVEAEEGRRNAEHLRALRGRSTSTGSEIKVRLLRAGDDADVQRLAERDSRAVPAGPLLGAEVDGHLIAALSPTTGKAIADPFQASSAAIELLRLRARQLDAGSQRPSRLRRVLHGLGRGHAHAGLASSPPGAGGRLLQL